MRTISDLKIGETGIISKSGYNAIPLNLLEMGVLPNKSVKLITAINDVLYLVVDGSHIVIRMDTAKLIKIKKQ